MAIEVAVIAAMLKWLMLNEKDIARFFAKVNKTNTCWLWLAAKYRNGYGAFSIKHKMFYAHRISWLIHYQDSRDLFILHKCDVRDCVNPDHLFEGTQAENMNDARRKGRMAIGEANGRSRLTPELVLQIRKIQGPQAVIAQVFGISQSSVSRIKAMKQFQLPWVSRISIEITSK